MRRIHFDGKGPVWWHYPFWQPWGCLGCFGRILLFLLLFFIFMLLMSQFRRCSDDRSGVADRPEEEVVEVVADDDLGRVPPINERDVIGDNGRQIVSNRLNVLFQAEVGVEGIDSWKTKFKELYPGDEFEIIFLDYNTKLLGLQVPAERRSELISALPGQIPDIPFMVFEEEVMDMVYRPSDPALNNADESWHLEACDVASAWDRTKGCEHIVVAVVDSYFDLNNPEFEGTNIISPYNVATRGSDVGLPSDYDSSNPDPVLCHGTMVASLALGGMDNGHGSAGISPECSFMPISLGRQFGCMALLQGLLVAVNRGADVVNISAGLTFSEEVSQWPVDRQIAFAQSELLSQAEVWKYVFDMCDKYGVTVVWAAGNENVFTALDASKRGENTIKVSATDRNGEKAVFSNFGNFADRNIYESTVSAPGAKVYGEIPGGDAALVDGTSFSAPIVAGAVGLMKSLDATLTTTQISEILCSTGVPVRGSSTVGPSIRIGAALDKVFESFLEFDTLKGYCTSTLNDTVTVPSTLIQTYIYDSDRTIRPALVQVIFRFTGNGKGEIVYKGNMWPDAPWTANIECSYDASEDKVTIKQIDASRRQDDIYNEPCKFVIKSEDGKSRIEMTEPNILSESYKAYLKIG